MSQLDPMADLHSHLLPGVDDGSQSAEQSIDVLSRMARENVTAVCLTPHFSAIDLLPARLSEKLHIHQQASAQLQAIAPTIPSRYTGAEVMLDGPLPEGAILDRRITLAGSRYLLVEFPYQLSADSISRLVTLITERGLVPVIAHPERYPCSKVEAAYAWRERGAVIQLDATTVASGRGSRAERARNILRAGLADILAADNHGDARTLAAARQYLTRLGAEEIADYLLTVNPFAILRDQALEAVPPMRTRRSPGSFFWNLFRWGRS